MKSQLNKCLSGLLFDLVIPIIILFASPNVVLLLIWFTYIYKNVINKSN